MQTYKEILPQIKVFVFDVDGVITNGNVFLIGDEVVRMLNSRDGYALQYASKMGYAIFAITGGSSKAVKTRLKHLGATEVYLNASNKLDVYQEMKEKYNIKDEEVLYMGDDIPDTGVMQKVALPSCPADASVEAKSFAKYISPFEGGRHCVRDVIEQTLRVQGKWMGVEALEW